VSSAHKTFKEYHPALHQEVSILQVAEVHVHTPVVVVEVRTHPLAVVAEVHGHPLVVAAEVQEAGATADRLLIYFNIKAKTW
jgi:hypothetical protein